MEEKAEGKGLDNGNSDRSELKLGGNILLSGFSLEPAEMIVVKKIIGNHIKKISEKTDYQDIKITLKKTQKTKSFLHEISAIARTSKGILSADAVNNNLYTALSEALNRVYSQAEHKKRTSRQEK